MEVFVKTLTGKVLIVQGNPTDTISKLMDSITQLSGVPPDQMRLIFDGMQLREEGTLSSYNITNRATVHLVLRLRGLGAPIGMEHAMLRSSDVTEGTFKSLASITFERDEAYPIRATFQFYRVTDTTQMDDGTFSSIRRDVDSVHEMGHDKGSLVIDSGNRVTESSTTTSLGDYYSTGAVLHRLYNDAT
jgi:hypothetical protein